MNGSLQNRKIGVIDNHEIIVKLKGVDDREAAQILATVKLVWILSVSQNWKKGDYYWHDLIGCSVVNLEGYTMGTVTEMMEPVLMMC